MSQIASLLDALKKHDAQEMHLQVGERIYMLQGGQRRDLGREPLQETILENTAQGVIGPDGVESLAKTPKTVTVTHGGETYEIFLHRPNGTIAIQLRRVLTSSQEVPDPPSTPTPTAPGPPNGGTVQGVQPTNGGTSPVTQTPVSVEAGNGHSEFDQILQSMVSEGASDLHLSADVAPVMRVDGEIRFLNDRGTFTSDRIENLLLPIMSDDVRERFKTRRDADLAYEIPGVSRFRVNVFEDRKGVGTVVRQIPFDILTAEQLGLPKPVLDLCNLTKGLVLVTGPTGSGKSTTLAAMVDYINKNRSDHIITIEDPIEFVHQNQKCLMNQREVGRHTESFKDALRAALREDPDIVLVGEMRDLETIAIAIETAETGHLVFGTLHTTTAVSTVDRIIDQFPPDRQAQIRVMLSDALKGVVAQVLCKKTGGGRLAALEILLGNQAVASLIREGKTFQIASIMQTSKRQGMTTMNDSLLAHVKDKKVEPKEAWMKATDKTGLISMLKGASIPVSFSE